MAYLTEAFNGLDFQYKNIKNIDYFFTQRNMKENQEFLDKHMNRKYKKINITYNYLALNIPNNNTKCFEIIIFGDTGYQYKGTITSFQGNIPNLMFPIKGDKKIFVHIQFNENNENNENNEHKDYVCFIDVPKRYQSIDINLDNNNNNLKQDNTSEDNDNDN
jgi:hypothetical protein